MKKLKTESIYISPFDHALVGQKLVFANYPRENTIGTVIAVTKERVIYITPTGSEGWSWITPNGKSATFDILRTKDNKKIIKAQSLQKSYLDLQENYDNLKRSHDSLKSWIKDLKEIGE